MNNPGLRYIAWLFLFLFPRFCLTQTLLSKEHVSKQPYTRYTLKVKDTVTYYLTEFDKESQLPLVIYIQGSGYQSLFYKDSSGIIKPASGHISLAYLVKGKAKLLIIEKPGVEFAKVGETNSAFDEKFSLDSWANRITSCIDYVLTHEKIDSDKVMLIGHSEGGEVAARVAALMQQTVSHTAILAGEGTTQLYSLYRLAEEGKFFNAVGKSPGQRKDSLLSEWNKILSDPFSVKKKFWGLTYLRWSSFLKTSTYDELSRYNGKILIGQGEADAQVWPESAKVLYTGLMAKGKNVQFIMMPGADHSFNLPGTPAVNGWEMILRYCLDWMLPGKEN